MTWEQNFSDATTSAAFSLQLSSRMIEVLAVIKDYKGRRSEVHLITHWIGSFRALERRGLAEHNPEKLPKWIYRLTPAGEHVYDLCVMAGLIDERVFEDRVA